MLYKIKETNIAVMGIVITLLGVSKQFMALKSLDSLEFFNWHYSINEIISLFGDMFPYVISILLFRWRFLILKNYLKTERKRDFLDDINWNSFCRIILTLAHIRNFYYELNDGRLNLFLVSFFVVLCLLDRDILGDGIKNFRKVYILIMIVWILYLFFSIDIHFSKYYVTDGNNCEIVQYTNGDYIFTSNGIKKITENMIFKKTESNMKDGCPKKQPF